MKIRITLFAACIVFAASLPAQIANLKTPLSEVPQVIMPSLNNEALRRTELENRAPGRAPRFAESHAVDISPQTHGRWEETPSGEAVWRLRVRSAGALSLNFGFDSYFMPEGGKLFLFSPDESNILGPFSPSDNEEHAQLWTPIVDGEEVVIEVQVPIEKRTELQLHLQSVNHDFMGFSSIVSGSCNLDVVCGAADGWAIVDAYRDIIQSVAVYGTGGTTFCTGFLVNNARNDCTPFFMTASHCGITAGNAPSMVVYWNYQNTTCRQPGSAASGGPGNGSLNNFNTGATLRARFPAADATLVELNNPVPESANAFYAGWNLSNQTPQDTVICVHHPSTDEKRISFEFDPTHPGNWGSGAQNIPTGNHIIVPDWDIGTTEGGSSGSPLFNRNKQVVGQLHGGAASCNNNSYDSYGWIFYSWTGGGTPATSLRSWLDPDDTGITELDGRWARLCSYSLEPVIAGQTVCAPDTAEYSIVVSENFEDSVALELTGLPPGADFSFSENPAAPGSTVVLIITGTENTTPGSYTMNLSGTDGDNSTGTMLTLAINIGLPEAPELLNPADGAIGEIIAPNFSWAAQQPGTRYTFELASDPDFNNIVGAVSDLNANNLSNQVLMPNTTYYWRVRGNSSCGEGPWSETRSFTTAPIICAAKAASDLPITISTSGTPQINSTVAIAAPGLVSQVKITGLDIRHTWVGDLRATLISPSGTAVVLFDQPGVPASQFGCNGDDLLLSFDDFAPNTALQLETSCNPGSPTIFGNFQPVDALIAFAGEPATGVWTLRVNDFVNQDGGSLQAWTIEICTSLPHEADIFPTQTAFALCASDTVTFEVGIGTAFNTPEVTLDFEGLPPGAGVAFSQNPATLGAIVTVQVWGFSAAGAFTPNLTATDGSQSATVDIDFAVSAPPAAPALLNPLPGAVRVSRNPTLSWGVIPGATAYRLWVATDSDFNNVVANPTLPATSFALSNLPFATTYYWRVEAQNNCGWGSASVASQFTTVGDLSFSAGTPSVTACNTGTASYALLIGPGYDDDLTFSVTATGPGAVLPQLNFGSATPGETTTATVNNLLLLAAGTYQITVTVSDGIDMANTTLTLIVQVAPGFPTLVAPADGATMVGPTPLLTWSTVSGATGYRVEIARDEIFTDIVVNVIVAANNYTPVQALEPNTYFWRVTALNNCGNATTAPFEFVVTPSSVQELAGVQLRIDPNPTSGPVNILLQGPMPADWSVAVYHVNGMLLQQREISRSDVSAIVDLSAYPAGVYLLRLQTGANVLTRRIIRQ